jgi:predicted XRE-type DNA-binding protein
MRAKKVANSEHGPRHVTPARRSVFYDLFPAEKAAELEMRAQLLMGLERWLENSRMTQAEAAKVLGVTQARVSDLKRGKFNRFSMLRILIWVVFLDNGECWSVPNPDIRAQDNWTFKRTAAPPG